METYLFVLRDVDLVTLHADLDYYTNGEFFKTVIKEWTEEEKEPYNEATVYKIVNGKVIYITTLWDNDQILDFLDQISK